MQWYDWIRVCTIVLSLSAMYFLIKSWRQRHSEYTQRLKDFWWVLNVLLFSFALGSIEQIARNREVTWTLFLGFFASIVANKALANKE